MHELPTGSAVCVDFDRTDRSAFDTEDPELFDDPSWYVTD